MDAGQSAMSAGNPGFMPRLPPLPASGGGEMLMQTLGQLFWLPFTWLGRWLEALAPMASMAAMAPAGPMPAMPNLPPLPNLPAESHLSQVAPAAPRWPQDAGADRMAQMAQMAHTTQRPKEERKMSDCGCCDNDHGLVKLVQYTIVSIKRCDERILKQGELIEAEEMSDEAFATWVVAMYLQEEHVHVPHEDKKFLRVYHHVLQSWPRQGKDCCTDREVDVLRGIEEAIRNLGAHKHEGHHEEPPPPPARGRQSAAAAAA
jgi:hypothetical protein